MMKKVFGLSLVLGALVVSAESCASAQKLSNVKKSEGIELKDISGDAHAQVAPKQEESKPESLKEVKKEEAKKNLVVRVLAASIAKTGEGLKFAGSKISNFFSAIWSWFTKQYNTARTHMNLASIKRFFAKKQPAQPATLKDATFTA